MQRKIKISVIVPIFNVEKYLERCIESIIKQTYRDLEIILVDDGSTDNSSIICDNYKNKDSRIVVLHKKNEGQSLARKDGIKLSTCDYISFIDADDCIDLNFYELMVNAINNDLDTDIVYCKVKGFCDEPDYEITYSTDIKRIEKQYCLYDIVQKKSIFNNYMVNKIYKKSLFDNIIFPNNNIYEDLAIMYKIIFNAKTIYFCDNYLYFYFDRVGSSSKKVKSNHVLFKMNNIEEREKFIKENFIELSKTYEIYHVKNILYCGVVISRNGDKKLYKNFVKTQKTYLKNIIKKYGFFHILKNLKFKDKILFLIFNINDILMFNFVKTFFKYN